MDAQTVKTTYYVIVPILGVVALVILAAIVRRPKGPLVDDEETDKLLTAAEMEQDAKNRVFVYNIIDAPTNSQDKETKDESKKAFIEWQKTQKMMKMMFRKASAERLKLRSEYISKSKANAFSFIYSDELPSLSSHGDPLHIFLKNCFTEPFPSTHDMDDFAMSTQAADIFLLNGISEEEAKSYYFRKKQHYVNHQMIHGIIQFDVYKRNA
jgi:hypothetical protein